MQLSAQSWNTIATDAQGDDHNFGMDAESLEFRYSAAEDSIYIKLNHYTARAGDFGYAIALDTNLNPNDGSPVPQNNLVSGSPNLSMNYNLILYVYQNFVFPGLNVETYNGVGAVWSASISIDTSDQFSLTIGIRLSDIGDVSEMNIIAFTGSFDISPAGAGPSDAIPDNTYAEIRKSGIGLTELDNTVGLFPNPAQDEFYLQYTGMISLFDVVGNRIGTKYVVENEPVHCDDLLPGMYIVTTQEGQVLTKLLKQ